MADTVDPSTTAAAAAAGAAIGLAAAQPRKTEEKKQPNWWLIGFGLLLVGLFVAGIVYARAVGSKTTEATTQDGAQGSAQQAGTKATTTKNVPSDTVLTAILATGAALVVVGALYSRIATIKLPGGAEVGFVTPKEAKTVADKVTQVAQDKNLPPDQVEKAAADAIRRVASRKAFLAAPELSDTALAQTVDEVTEPL